MKRILALLALMSPTISSSAQLIATGHPIAAIHAGSCVPQDTAIQNDWYQVVTGGGRVKFKGNHLNTIKLVCPIPKRPGISSIPTTQLTIFYQDPDGGSIDYQVTGRLRAFAKDNGAFSTVATVVSSESGPWGFSSSDFVSVNYADNLYWIEVEISRKRTDQTVEFNGYHVGM